MVSTGMFKYKCNECGNTELIRRHEFSTKTNKRHCRKCGGTFWEPISRNAQVDFFRTSVGREATRNAGADNRNRAHTDLLVGQNRFGYTQTKLVEAESGGSEKATARGKKKLYTSSPVEMDNTPMSSKLLPTAVFTPEKLASIAADGIGRAKKRATP